MTRYIKTLLKIYQNRSSKHIEIQIQTQTQNMTSKITRKQYKTNSTMKYYKWKHNILFTKHKIGQKLFPYYIKFFSNRLCSSWCPEFVGTLPWSETCNIKICTTIRNVNLKNKTSYLIFLNITDEGLNIVNSGGNWHW